VADTTREPLLQVSIPSVAMQAGRIRTDQIVMQVITHTRRWQSHTLGTAAAVVILAHTASAALKPLAPLFERTNYSAALRGCCAKLLPLSLRKVLQVSQKKAFCVGGCDHPRGTAARAATARIPAQASRHTGCTYHCRATNCRARAARSPRPGLCHGRRCTPVHLPGYSSGCA